jgi:hypothetical protein
VDSNAVGQQNRIPPEGCLFYTRDGKLISPSIAAAVALAIHYRTDAVRETHDRGFAGGHNKARDAAGRLNVFIDSYSTVCVLHQECQRMW